MTIKPEVFKQVRKALGLTQEELADALGLSRVTINKMERGKLARGIPDDIADRLLALKPRSGAQAPRADVKATIKEQVVSSFLEDRHLWDNEEDES